MVISKLLDNNFHAEMVICKLPVKHFRTEMLVGKLPDNNFHTEMVICKLPDMHFRAEIVVGKLPDWHCRTNTIFRNFLTLGLPYKVFSDSQEILGERGELKPKTRFASGTSGASCY